MAWHILRKDWKLLRWLVVAVAALQVMLAAARFRLGHFIDVRELAALAGLPGSLIVFLVTAFVIAVAVHQDAVRQDWLVRPVKRTDLLLAKLLFVLVMIHGPMLATDVLQGLTNGLSDVSWCAPDYIPFPGHAIPDALSRFGGNLPFSDRSGLAKYPVNSGRLPEAPQP